MLIFAPLVIYWVVTLLVFVYSRRHIGQFQRYQRVTILLGVPFSLVTIGLYFYYFG